MPKPPDLFSKEITPTLTLEEGKLFCSKIKAWNRCKRYYYHSYIRNREPSTMRVAFYIGSTLHYGVMLLYQGVAEKDIVKKTKAFQIEYKRGQSIHPEMAEDMKIHDAIGIAMVQGYIRQYGKFAKSVKVVCAEQSFQTTLSNGVPFIGTVDLIYKIKSKQREGLWIEDHKTASGIHENTLNILPMNLQMSAYPAIVKRALGVQVDGIVYSIVKKPDIRLKNSETVAEFIERIIEEYTDKPDKYFHQEFIPYNPGTVSRVWNDIMQTANDMIRWYDSMDEEEILREENWPRNEQGCFPYGFKRENACPYYDICRDGEKAAFHKLQYFKQQKGTPRGEIVSKSVKSKAKDNILRVIGHR